MSLEANIFGHAGIQELADACAVNRTLAALNLANTGFDFDSDGLTLQMLARTVLLNTNLVDLNINGSHS